MVRQELREAWLARMKILLTRIPGPKVLLWLSDHPPRGEGDEPRPFGRDPLFVDAEMLGQLRAHVADIAVVVVGPDAIAEGRRGLVYPDLDEPVAQEMLGTVAHMRAGRGAGTDRRRTLQVLTASFRNRTGPMWKGADPAAPVRPAPPNSPCSYSLAVSSGTASNRSATNP
jgi:hypothetical protein